MRQLQSADTDAIIAIQRSSPEIAQWAACDYARVARGEMMGWVAEDGAEVEGFLVARSLVQETEILNFAVRADERRRRIGTALLNAALDWSRSITAEKVMLEVRASNAVALKFYERHGFAVAGRRANYYADPVDDALLLSLPLPGSAREPKR